MTINTTEYAHVQSAIITETDDQGQDHTWQMCIYDEVGRGSIFDTADRIRAAGCAVQLDHESPKLTDQERQQFAAWLTWYGANPEQYEVTSRREEDIPFPWPVELFA